MPGFVRGLFINKSGSAYNIYDYDNNYNYVGKLNNREAYIIHGGGGGVLGISFLNSSGTLQHVNVDNNRYPLPGYSDYSGYPSDHSCINYPYGTIFLDGKEYYTFKVRSQRNVYYYNGDKWGSVAAGCLVATDCYTIGDNNPHYKLIQYVQKSTGEWIRVDSDGRKYGFVDTGIQNASGYSKIPFYGSW